MLQTKQETKNDNVKSSDLSQKLENISNSNTLQTKIVPVIFSSCCGCGCHEYLFNRTVPIDSTLTPYSQVSDLNDSGPNATDEFVKVWHGE